jgi:Disulfide bond chaperones of the HSP33 family
MIQATLAPEVETRLSALEADGITVFTLGGGRVRGELLHGTRMVAQMAANHSLGGLETLVLGRAYLCAGLLTATVKEGDRLVLRVDGNGPAEGLSVEASPDGSVRGRLFRSPIELEAEAEPGSAESLNVFGSGTLTMTRFNQDKPHPFVGRVELATGSLAQDIAAYYLESEQTRTAFDLSIEFDRAGRAIGAGALFLQALPGADDEFLERVEAAIPSLPRLGPHFARGGKRADYLDASMHDLFPEILGEKPAAFACSCSRERFAAFLGSGNEDFLEELATVGPWPIETVCHNCGSAYYFEKPEIESMLAARRKK